MKNNTFVEIGLAYVRKELWINKNMSCSV